MQIIWLLLVFLLSSCLTVGVVTESETGSAVIGPDTAPDAAMPDDVVHYDVLIDDVTLTTDMSGPVLTLNGTIPDGCNFPINMAISEGGDTITVDVYRTGPVDAACPEVATAYSDTIQLSHLDPGTYTIIVNGQTYERVLTLGMQGRSEPEPPQIDPPADAVQ